MKIRLRQQFGLFRSLAMYYGIPFRGRRLTQFYRPFVETNDLCFDVGAHVGNHTHAFWRLGARVVALEPQPLFMRFLKFRYGRYDTITLRQSAVGAQPGQTKMYISQRTPTVTTLSANWIAATRKDASFSNVTWDETERVELVTLDQLIETFGLPRFCKIDVEGYELEVLVGLTKQIPMIAFEFVPAAMPTAQQCIRRISELGDYRFNWSVGETYQLQAPRWILALEMDNILMTRLLKGRSGDIYAKRVNSSS